MTAGRLAQQLDFDASAVLEGHKPLGAPAERLFDVMLDIASGALTWGEVLGEGEEVVSRFGPVPQTAPVRPQWAPAAVGAIVRNQRDNVGTALRPLAKVARVGGIGGEDTLGRAEGHPAAPQRSPWWTWPKEISSNSKSVAR